MAEEVVEVEKVFNTATQKFEDKPAETTTTSETKEETKTEETAAATTETTAATTKEEPAKTFEPGSYLKEKYGEKFGIESEKDLEVILGAQDELVSAHDKAKQEIENLKANPVYRSEQEKKIAEFLKPFPPERFGEGLSTAAAIIGMDPANIPGRLAMEEAFILTKPHLTRDEAKEMFADTFNDLYPKINKDDFDTEELYNKKKRSIELRLKDAEAEARKVLIGKQSELKAKPEEKKDATQEKPIEAPAESVKAYTEQADKFFNGDGKTKGFDRIPYLGPDGKEVAFNLVIDKEKLDDVKKFVQNYIKNPSVYEKDGKIAKFDPQELAKMGLRLLHGDWVETQLWSEVTKQAAKMKAEQIAGASPDKKSAGEGDAKLGTIDQFKQLAQKAKEARTR